MGTTNPHEIYAVITTYEISPTITYRSYWADKNKAIAEAERLSAGWGLHLRKFGVLPNPHSESVYCIPIVLADFQATDFYDHGNGD